MAISVCYRANYVANKAKMSRMSEYAVDGDHVLKFLFDAALFHHQTAVCMMVAWSTVLIMTYDIVKPVHLSGL
jgi:hypothetical protein